MIGLIVITFQIEQLMEEQKISKTTMAARIQTSCAAIVLGKRLRIELI